MNKILLVVSAILLLGSTVLAETLTPEEVALVISSNEAQVDVFGSWEWFSQKPDHFPLVLEGGWYTLSGASGIDLDADALGTGNRVFVNYLNRWYEIEFRRGASRGKSTDAAVKIVELSSNTNCFDQTDSDGWVGRNVSNFFNTPLEGTKCGIKVFADWESAGFDTEVQINKIQLFKGTVESIVQEVIGPLKNQRMPSIKNVSASAGSFIDKLSVKSNETWGKGTYAFDLIKSTNAQLGNILQAKMDNEDLSFNVDNSQERSFTATFAEASWLAEMSHAGGQEVTFSITRTDTGCKMQETVSLNAGDNKNITLCGFGMRANWERLGVSDVDIEALWISKVDAAKILTNTLKGKDLLASLAFSKKAKQMNEIIRTVDVFDLENFQGAGGLRMYVGEKIGIAEDDLLDFDKYLYVAITADGEIQYVLYTPSRTGENFLKAKKINNTQQGVKIGRDQQIQSFEQFVAFFNSMTELEPQEISAQQINNIVTFGGLEKAQAQEAVAELANTAPSIPELKEIATTTALIGAAALTNPNGRVRGGLSTVIQHARNIGRPSIAGVRTRVAALPGQARVAATRTVAALRATQRTRQLNTLQRALNEIIRIEDVLVRANASSPGATTIQGALHEVQTVLLPEVRAAQANAQRARNLATVARHSNTAVTNAYRAAESVVSLGRLTDPTAAARYRAATTAILNEVDLVSTARNVERSRAAVRATQTAVAVVRGTRAVQTAQVGGRTFRIISAVGRGSLWTIRSGASVARAALLPAGPIGWGVLVVLTATDIGFITYDYTKLFTSAFDNGELIVNWDRGGLSTSDEIIVHSVIYSKPQTQLGEGVAFFTFDEAGVESLKTQGLITNDFSELASNGKLNVFLAEVLDASADTSAQGIVTLNGTEPNDAGEEIEVSYPVKKWTSVRLTAEKAGDKSIIVAHDIMPGAYLVEWPSASEDRRYELIVIGGIDDGSGSPMLDDEGNPVTDMPLIYEGIV